MAKANNSTTIKNSKSLLDEQIKEFRAGLLSNFAQPSIENCAEIMVLAQTLCRRAQLPMASILYCGETDGEDKYACYAVYPQECSLYLVDDRVTPAAWTMAGGTQDDELYQVLDTHEKLLEAFGVAPDKIEVM